VFQSERRRVKKLGGKGGGVRGEAKSEFRMLLVISTGNRRESPNEGITSGGGRVEEG